MKEKKFYLKKEGEALNCAKFERTLLMIKIPYKKSVYPNIGIIKIEYDNKAINEFLKEIFE